MIHKGVRIVLLIDEKTYLEIDSLQAHHVATFQGGEMQVLLRNAHRVELFLRACESDDTPPEDG